MDKQNNLEKTERKSSQLHTLVMQREIKFRGFDNSLGHWVIGFLVGDYIIDFEDFELCYEDIAEKSIGQFTGLKDKNGKDIYGGDIIRLPTSEIAIIVWFRGGFMLKLPNHFGYKDIENYDGDCEKYERIGNTFENPELVA